MKKLWTAQLTLGVVSIPVGMIVAQGDESPDMKLLHAGCGCKIKTQRRCPKHGDIEWNDVEHGVEVTKGQFVRLDEDVLAGMLPEKSNAIEIKACVPLANVDPMLVAKTYFLKPEGDGSAQKPYVLLRDAMLRNGVGAIVQFAHWNKDNLGLVVAAPTAGLLLHMLHWAEDLRDPEYTVADVTVTKDEAKLADTLIGQMTRPFDHAEFKNGTRDAIRSYVEATVAGREPEPAVKPAADAAPTDLVAALKASVETIKAKKAPARRAPARKRTAKKVAA